MYFRGDTAVHMDPLALRFTYRVINRYTRNPTAVHRECRHRCTARWILTSLCSLARQSSNGPIERVTYMLCSFIWKYYFILEAQLARFCKTRVHKLQTTRHMLFNSCYCYVTVSTNECVGEIQLDECSILINTVQSVLDIASGSVRSGFGAKFSANTQLMWTEFVGNFWIDASDRYFGHQAMHCASYSNWFDATSFLWEFE